MGTCIRAEVDRSSEQFCRATALRLLDETRNVRIGPIAPQSAPYGNLAFGAAGLAYGYCRAGYAFANRTLFYQADRLLRDLIRWRARRSLFHSARRGLTEANAPHQSVSFGMSGIHFARALTRHALGDEAGAKDAIERFMRSARRAQPGVLELYGGAAGHLSAASVLFTQTGARDQRAALTEFAEELWTRLIRMAGSPGRARSPWPAIGQNEGLAHGRGGLLLTLLHAADAFELMLPDWFWPSLGRWLEPWRRMLAGSRPTAPVPYSRASVCTGTGGVAIVCAKAYACAKERRYLELARRAGADALALRTRGAQICCQSAGVAYALAALARVDRDGPDGPDASWESAAARLAREALESPVSRDWPLNLMRGGKGGLLCIAVDFMRRGPRTFPLFGW
jgi:hypothetical protein